MLLYILLICLTTCHAQDNSEVPQPEASEPGKRIVGGTNAKEGEFPYQVSIRSARNGRHFCGGSIIYPNWIITAAHCLIDLKPSDFNVVVGSVKLDSGGSKYDVDAAILHKNYNNTSFQNDIALIKTKSPIEYMQPNIQNISLATKETPAGAKCVVSGWGYLQYESGFASNELKKLEVNAFSLENCQKKYARFKKTNPISNSQICAEKSRNTGTCSGDSGGPLVCDKELVGLVSFSVDCARGYPTVYTKGFAYGQWIKDTIDAS